MCSGGACARRGSEKTFQIYEAEPYPRALDLVPPRVLVPLAEAPPSRAATRRSCVTRTRQGGGEAHAPDERRPGTAACRDARGACAEMSDANFDARSPHTQVGPLVEAPRRRSR